jgi:hypothetical protein
MEFSRANLSARIDQMVEAQRLMADLRQSLQVVRALKSSATRAKLASLAYKRRLLCVTFQLGALELEADVPSYGFPVEVELQDLDNFAQLRDRGLTPDLALFRSHQLWNVDGSFDSSDLVEASRTLGDCLNLIWLWDHHHQFEASAKMILAADVVLPMHETGADYLKIFCDFVFPAVPAACAQWGGPRFVTGVYRENQARPRSNRLYGGFVEYPGFARNNFIRQCMAQIPEHALVLLPPTEARDIQHFGVATRRERLVEWMGYKVSLVSALAEDIPIRVLDGLLAGHIPLVPYNLNGFDRLISPALQAELPIVRYDPYDVDSVDRAWRAALALFDRAGPAGAARRHHYAVDNHLMKHRVADIILMVLNSARLYAGG